MFSYKKFYSKNFKRTSNDSLKKGRQKVPYWSRRYIYSFSQIDDATEEQKKFYEDFRTNFLNAEYIFLCGNMNYAFVLLFDLTKEYTHHQDFIKLQRQLRTLRRLYPKTRSTCNSVLRSIKNGVFYSTRNSRSSEKQRHRNFSGRAGSKFNRENLGTNYKLALNLNEAEVKLLNNIRYRLNSFLTIECCMRDLIKLFLTIIVELKARYRSAGKSVEQELYSITEVFGRSQSGRHHKARNYRLFSESGIRDIYSGVFRQCENKIRELYGYKRRINTDLFYTNEEFRSEQESGIITTISELLARPLAQIANADEQTELKLNEKIPNRWKNKFACITAQYNGDLMVFVDDIAALAKNNRNSPSVKNIFLEASKFIASHDRMTSFKFYIHFIYHDLHTSKPVKRKLPPEIQKNIPDKSWQQEAFETIIKELSQDKNQHKAIDTLSKIFGEKRKKIQLDNAGISKVQNSFTATVDLLNDYLYDEAEREKYSVDRQKTSAGKITNDIIQVNKICSSLHPGELFADQIHKDVLEIFLANGLRMQQEQLNEFAGSRGYFANYLIDSINEICYTKLDDILIETDTDTYKISPEYFQRIHRYDK